MSVRFKKLRAQSSGRDGLEGEVLPVVESWTFIHIGSVPLAIVGF